LRIWVVISYIDKTGSFDTDGNGMTVATNDIGIITLPNGRHFAIAVFIFDSYEKNEVNEKIIVEISRMVWYFFTKESFSSGEG
jgi:beta-lactamase class A